MIVSTATVSSNRMYKAAFSHATFSVIGCQPISAQVPWDILRKPARSSSASNSVTCSWFVVAPFCIFCDAVCANGRGVVVNATKEVEVMVVVAVDVGPGGAEQMGSRKL